MVHCMNATKQGAVSNIYFMQKLMLFLCVYIYWNYTLWFFFQIYDLDHLDVIIERTFFSVENYFDYEFYVFPKEQ